MQIFLQNSFFSMFNKILNFFIISNKSKFLKLINYLYSPLPLNHMIYRSTITVKSDQTFLFLELILSFSLIPLSFSSSFSLLPSYIHSFSSYSSPLSSNSSLIPLSSYSSLLSLSALLLDPSLNSLNPSPAPILLSAFLLLLSVLPSSALVLLLLPLFLIHYTLPSSPSFLFPLFAQSFPRLLKLKDYQKYVVNSSIRSVHDNKNKSQSDGFNVRKWSQSKSISNQRV